jgi:hypothetical protein
MSKLIALAKDFEAKLKSEAKPLLQKAMSKNKGHGINVLFNGQHFGWFEWDQNKKEHKQFSIGDFKPNAKVGKLEDVVGKLKVINLEDYK